MVGCGKEPKPVSEVPSPPQSLASAESIYSEAYQKLQRGELDAALKVLDRGSPSGTSPVWNYKLTILRAEVLLAQGKKKDALALVHGESPLELTTGEFAVRKELLHARGLCLLDQFQDVESLLNKAERLAGQGAPEWKGEVWLNRGTCSLLHIRPNQPNEAERDKQAERYFYQALDFARDHNQAFLQANALGSLGYASVQSRHYDKAVDWFSMALDLARSQNARRAEEKTLGNLGYCDYELGDYKKAIQEFTQAERLASALGVTSDERLWSTNLGNAYLQLENLAAAERFYSKSLSLAQGLNDQQSVELILHNLAQLELQRKNPDKAEEYNRKVIAIETNSSQPPDPYSRLTSAEIAMARKDSQHATHYLLSISSRPEIPIWLRWRAQSDLANVYAAQDRSALANGAFLEAMRMVTTERKRVRVDERKLAFLDAPLFDDYIRFLIQRNKLGEALRIADFSRARTLTEGLGERIHPPDIRTVQTLLKKSQVILFYGLARDESLLWVIMPSEIKLFRLPAKAEIDRKIEDYNKALLGSHASAKGNRNGQALYEMLVKPAEQFIPHNAKVVIVRDGSLNGLNFETLIVPGSPRHYWIEDVEIENAASFALFANSMGRTTENFSKLLLIGDPVQASKQYPILAHAHDEIERVEAHFAPSDTTLIDGANAAPSAYLKSRPDRFGVIHFVTHGTASQIKPLDSAIILSSEGTDSFKLYARDIVGIKIHAGVVTVSACYGAGTLTGEGLVGLAWSFMRAGAHHVIAGLWEVNDNSTPQLMDHFYKTLRANNDPAAALRSAKQAMLHSNSIYKKPYYWASLQLYTGS